MDGEVILTVERRDSGDGQLLMSVEIYDADGNRVGRLHRNTWVDPVKGHADITLQDSPSEIALTKIDRTLFHAVVRDKNHISVESCSLYGRAGSHCEVNATSGDLVSESSGTTVGGNIVQGSDRPLRFLSGGGFALG